MQCDEAILRTHPLSLDVLQADGLTGLLVVVGVVLPGRQLQERLRDELALAVPRASDSFVQLEDGIAHVHVGGHALRLGLAFVVVNGTWQSEDGVMRRNIPPDTARSTCTDDVDDVPERMPSSSLSYWRATVMADRRSAWAVLLFLRNGDRQKINVQVPVMVTAQHCQHRYCNSFSYACQSTRPGPAEEQTSINLDCVKDMLYYYYYVIVNIVKKNSKK